MAFPENLLPVFRVLAAAVVLATGSAGCYSAEDHNQTSSSTDIHHKRTMPDIETRLLTPPGGIRKRLVSHGDVSTAKLTGFMTPCEYFVVKSKHHPANMAVVSLPVDYQATPNRRYPLVIAFGGAGECARPPDRGALAWIHYYKTDEATAALRAGRLLPGDFRDLAGDDEIKRFNKRLNRYPYHGIILVCPASPLLMGSKNPEFPEYEAYVMRDLIPALQKHYRVAEGCMGVDGVSLGGTRSMYYGFKYPEVFQSIGSIQGAVGPFMKVYRQLVVQNRNLLRKRFIQLVTSDQDVMAPSVVRMRDLLKRYRIPCRFLKLSGPHDYIFNQGPGALALLMFHNQVLECRPHGPVK